MTNEAKVNILLAAHNGAPFIEEQIRSIQGQTNPEWRLFVSDDCSTDDTVYRVRRLASDDSRIRLVVWPSRSGSASRQFLRSVKILPPGYLMFCDQDDIWLPDKIEVSLACMNALERRHGVCTPCLVHTDLKVVDQDLNIVADSFVEYARIDVNRTIPTALTTNCVTGCTAMVNASLRDLLIKTPDSAFFVMHDWLIYLLAESFGRRMFVDRATVLYRQHDSNVAGAIPDRFLTKLSLARQSRETNIAAIRQARDFYGIYGPTLTNLEASQTLEYGTLLEKKRMPRLKSLFKTRAFKPSVSGFLLQMASILCASKR